jgi:hypothetical protein
MSMPGVVQSQPAMLNTNQNSNSNSVDLNSVLLKAQSNQTPIKISPNLKNSATSQAPKPIKPNKAIKSKPPATNTMNAKHVVNIQPQQPQPQSQQPTAFILSANGQLLPVITTAPAAQPRNSTSPNSKIAVLNGKCAIQPRPISLKPTQPVSNTAKSVVAARSKSASKSTGASKKIADDSKSKRLALNPQAAKTSPVLIASSATVKNLAPKPPAVQIQPKPAENDSPIVQLDLNSILSASTSQLNEPASISNTPENNTSSLNTATSLLSTNVNDSSNISNTPVNVNATSSNTTHNNGVKKPREIRPKPQSTTSLLNMAPAPASTPAKLQLNGPAISIANLNQRPQPTILAVPQIQHNQQLNSVSKSSAIVVDTTNDILAKAASVIFSPVSNASAEFSNANPSAANFSISPMSGTSILQAIAAQNTIISTTNNNPTPKVPIQRNPSSKAQPKPIKAAKATKTSDKEASKNVKISPAVGSNQQQTNNLASIPISTNSLNLIDLQKLNESFADWSEMTALSNSLGLNIISSSNNQLQQQQQQTQIFQIDANSANTITMDQNLQMQLQALLTNTSVTVNQQNNQQSQPSIIITPAVDQQQLNSNVTENSIENSIEAAINKIVQGYSEEPDVANKSADTSLEINKEATIVVIVDSKDKEGNNKKIILNSPIKLESPIKKSPNSTINISPKNSNKSAKNEEVILSMPSLDQFFQFDSSNQNSSSHSVQSSPNIPKQSPSVTQKPIAPKTETKSPQKKLLPLLPLSNSSVTIQPKNTEVKKGPESTVSSSIKPILPVNKKKTASSTSNTDKKENNESVNKKPESVKTDKKEQPVAAKKPAKEPTESTKANNLPESIKFELSDLDKVLDQVESTFGTSTETNTNSTNKPSVVSHILPTLNVSSPSVLSTPPSLLVSKKPVAPNTKTQTPIKPKSGLVSESSTKPNLEKQTSPTKPPKVESNNKKRGRPPKNPNSNLLKEFTNSEIAATTTINEQVEESDALKSNPNDEEDFTDFVYDIATDEEEEVTSSGLNMAPSSALSVSEFDSDLNQIIQSTALDVLCEQNEPNVASSSQDQHLNQSQPITIASLAQKSTNMKRKRNNQKSTFNAKSGKNRRESIEKEPKLSDLSDSSGQESSADESEAEFELDKSKNRKKRPAAKDLNSENESTEISNNQKSTTQAVSASEQKRKRGRPPKQSSGAPLAVAAMASNSKNQNGSNSASVEYAGLTRFEIPLPFDMDENNQENQNPFLANGSSKSATASTVSTTPVKQNVDVVDSTINSDAKKSKLTSQDSNASERDEESDDNQSAKKRKETGGLDMDDENSYDSTSSYLNTSDAHMMMHIQPPGAPRPPPNLENDTLLLASGNNSDNENDLSSDSASSTISNSSTPANGDSKSLNLFDNNNKEEFWQGAADKSNNNDHPSDQVNSNGHNNLTMSSHLDLENDPILNDINDLHQTASSVDMKQSSSTANQLILTPPSTVSNVSTASLHTHHHGHNHHHSGSNSMQSVGQCLSVNPASNPSSNSAQMISPVEVNMNNNCNPNNQQHDSTLTMKSMQQNDTNYSTNTENNSYQSNFYHQTENSANNMHQQSQNHQSLSRNNSSPQLINANQLLYANPQLTHSRSGSSIQPQPQQQQLDTSLNEQHFHQSPSHTHMHNNKNNRHSMSSSSSSSSLSTTPTPTPMQQQQQLLHPSTPTTPSFNTNNSASMVRSKSSQAIDLSTNTTSNNSMNPHPSQLGHNSHYQAAAAAAAVAVSANIYNNPVMAAAASVYNTMHQQQQNNSYSNTDYYGNTTISMSQNPAAQSLHHLNMNMSHQVAAGMSYNASMMMKGQLNHPSMNPAASTATNPFLPVPDFNTSNNNLSNNASARTQSIPKSSVHSNPYLNTSTNNQMSTSNNNKSASSNQQAQSSVNINQSYYGQNNYRFPNSESSNSVASTPTYLPQSTLSHNPQLPPHLDPFSSSVKNGLLSTNFPPMVPQAHNPLFNNMSNDYSNDSKAAKKSAKKSAANPVTIDLTTSSKKSSANKQPTAATGKDVSKKSTAKAPAPLSNPMEMAHYSALQQAAASANWYNYGNSSSASNTVSSNTKTPGELALQPPVYNMNAAYSANRPRQPAYLPQTGLGSNPAATTYPSASSFFPTQQHSSLQNASQSSRSNNSSSYYDTSSQANPSNERSSAVTNHANQSRSFAANPTGPDYHQQLYSNSSAAAAASYTNRVQAPYPNPLGSYQHPAHHPNPAAALGAFLNPYVTQPHSVMNNYLANQFNNWHPSI